MSNRRRKKQRRRPLDRAGPAGPPTSGVDAAPGELRPNKPCPRCGAENIASADRCLACGAAFEGAERPPAGDFAKGAKATPGPRVDARPGRPERSWWRNDVCRVLGIAAIGGLTY